MIDNVMMEFNAYVNAALECSVMDGHFGFVWTWMTSEWSDGEAVFTFHSSRTEPEFPIHGLCGFVKRHLVAARGGDGAA